MQWFFIAYLYPSNISSSLVRHLRDHASVVHLLFWNAVRRNCVTPLNERERLDHDALIDNCLFHGI